MWVLVCTRQWCRKQREVRGGILLWQAKPKNVGGIAIMCVCHSAQLYGILRPYTNTVLWKGGEPNHPYPRPVILHAHLPHHSSITASGVRTRENARTSGVRFCKERYLSWKTSPKDIFQGSVWQGCPASVSAAIYLTGANHPRNCGNLRFFAPKYRLLRFI